MRTRKARVELEGERPELRGAVVIIPSESEIRRMAVTLHLTHKEHHEIIGDWEIEYTVAIPDEGIPNYFMIQSTLKIPDGRPFDSIDRMLFPALGVWRVLFTWRNINDDDPICQCFFENVRFLAEDRDDQPNRDDHEYRNSSLAEGALVRAERNVYERSSEARQLCLTHYGTQCIACGFDFGQTYGSVANGFIHVHHLEPISTTGLAHEVDPIRDLRPLCPNCHAVTHLRVPPYTIDELKIFLSKNQQR